ncbi:MAG: RNA methyltransferase [Arcanobacterium sp.]|nr:RNA methyltransferase [Arcanobacterium sp.]
MPHKVLNGWSAQLKKTAGLEKAANRRRFEQLRVEGVQAVREVLACAPERVRDLFVASGVLAAHADIAQLVETAGVYVHEGTAELIARAAPSSQGIFAVVQMAAELSVDAVFCSRPQLVVCCVQASDPGNLGTIIRTADAAGAEAVVVGPGSADPHSPKVIRAAAGSTFHVPVLEAAPEAVVQRAKTAGMLVALADARGSVDLLTAQHGHGEAAPLLSAPTVWLVGNEARGFSPQQREWADVVIGIPMWGRAESLNLSVATALCLYASASAQRGACERGACESAHC